MHAHYLQHVQFEGPGSIESALKTSGCEITSTQFHEGMSLPEVNEPDLLVVLGGPMSVNDEGGFPWLAPEKMFIREVIRAGKSVLGVCLGAQLIASALGARVYRNRVKEIGWFPVQAAPSPDTSGFRFPPSLEVFHWHGETFDLPAGATLLAKSAGCQNQAFQLGRSVIGLQFHLETTPDSAREIVTHCRAELSPSKYVQSEAAILAVPPGKFLAINHFMSEVINYLLGGAG